MAQALKISADPSKTRNAVRGTSIVPAYHAAGTENAIYGPKAARSIEMKRVTDNGALYLGGIKTYEIPDSANSAV